MKNWVAVSLGKADYPDSLNGDVFSFEVDPFKKHCLLNGLDDIGLTMEKSSSIEAFEKKLEIERPWL